MNSAGSVYMNCRSSPFGLHCMIGSLPNAGSTAVFPSCGRAVFRLRYTSWAHAVRGGIAASSVMVRKPRVLL
jgi:hypothetical protein